VNLLIIVTIQEDGVVSKNSQGKDLQRSNNLSQLSQSNGTY
jgi:hypothetical protein